MIRDVNSAFSPDQSVLSFSSSAQLLHGGSAADVSPAYFPSSGIRIVLLKIKGGIRNVSQSPTTRDRPAPELPANRYHNAARFASFKQIMSRGTYILAKKSAERPSGKGSKYSAYLRSKLARCCHRCRPSFCII